MPLKIALVLYPKMNPFHFSVPYMIFTDAMPEKGLFELKLVAEDNKLPTDVMHLKADGDLSLIEQATIVIIPGWHDYTQPPSAELLQALQKAYQRGAYLVGLCFGTYALAYTGLLDNKKAATHWFGEQDFSRRFPLIRLDTNALYVEDQQIITSAGTTAALDCCLYIVRKFYGVKIANKVARIMVAPPHREGGQAQFIERSVQQTDHNNRLSTLLEKLRQNPANTYSIDDLAAQAHISRRTFTRHFQKTTGTSFTQWLINERLQISLELLESSRLSIEKIAEQTGFQSAVNFRQHFKQRFKVSPNDWRKTFSAEP